MQITVSRAINGIGLNGDEFLLDDEGNVLTFPNEQNARTYLEKKGVPKDEIDTFNFHEESGIEVIYSTREAFMMHTPEASLGSSDYNPERDSKELTLVQLKVSEHVTDEELYKWVHANFYSPYQIHSQHDCTGKRFVQFTNIYRGLADIRTKDTRVLIEVVWGIDV